MIVWIDFQAVQSFRLLLEDRKILVRGSLLERQRVVVDEKASPGVGEAAREQQSSVNDHVGAVGGRSRTAIVAKSSRAKPGANWVGGK